MKILSLYPLPIKVPLFPYLYRSPEVHGEANTSISMFSAALLLKLGIFGIPYYISLPFFLIFLLNYYSISSMGWLGIIIISCTTFRLLDLKKIVAFSSIIHLNYSLIMLRSISSFGILSSISISFPHSILSFL